MANSRRRFTLDFILTVVAVFVTAAVPSPSASAQPPAGVPPNVYAVLKDIKAADKGQLAVSEEDGRFLRLMVASSRASRALEIGGASGYSAIWIGLGLRETGGKLVTIEYDAQRARELKTNIARAGLEDVVHAVAGDAFKEVPKVAGSLDFVFVDAWKPDYKKYFDMVFPKLAPGGLLLAHNVRNKATEMQPFLSAIEGHPDLLTTIVSPSSEGMSVSWKRH
jgi:predicted O-methyltransferase YrrM